MTVFSLSMCDVFSMIWCQVLDKYEVAFVAKHGRKMRTQAEIATIATEYARFKQIKHDIAEIEAEHTLEIEHLSVKQLDELCQWNRIDTRNDRIA